MKQKNIGGFLVEVSEAGYVTLADKDLDWKYWIEIWKKPKHVAKNLRKIADWLEKC